MLTLFCTAASSSGFLGAPSLTGNHSGVALLFAAFFLDFVAMAAVAITSTSCFLLVIMRRSLFKLFRFIPAVLLADFLLVEGGHPTLGLFYSVVPASLSAGLAFTEIDAAFYKSCSLTLSSKLRCSASILISCSCAIVTPFFSPSLSTHSFKPELLSPSSFP